MSNEKILAEAKERFRRCQAFETQSRSNYRSDMAFGYGDSINQSQWEGDVIDARSSQGKPVLTMNRTKNYCYQILNDAKAHPIDIEVRAVGNGASHAAAECYEGLIRHIAYRSNSIAVYDKALHDCVFGGIGWFRITTAYAGHESWDQELFITPVKDAMSVYVDPFCTERNCSDARFGFVFSDQDKSEFLKTYGKKYKNIVGDLPFDMETEGDDLWVREDRIRICEYFRRQFESDTLHLLDDGSSVKESDYDDPAMLDMIRQRSQQSREISKPRVEWYLIAGSKIIDQGTFPSQYIPLVKVCAVETMIDGQLDRVSHVRSLRDSQVSYNYFSSSGVEYIANQSRSPWIADVASIEGLETYWRDSNTKSYSVLPYRGRGDDGQEIEAPRRADPPVYASGFLDGLKVAANEMELCSAQPEAIMGDPSNERSGVALEKRTRAAANSTYHFVWALAQAVEHAGRILIDAIPQVYDTERTLKILAQDGTQTTIAIDPNAPQAHMPVPALDGESLDPQQVAAVLNPAIGEYSIIASSGEAFESRRMEFVKSMLDVMAQAESIAPLCLDLVVRHMDFPGSEEVADRLRRMVPPQALGTVDPQIQQLQMQLAAQHQLLQQQQQELFQAKQKAESIAYMREIDYYKAETERLKAVGTIDPAALKPIVRELVSQVLGMPVNNLIQAHMHEDAIATQFAANQAAQMAQTDVQLNQGHPPMPAQQPQPAQGSL